MFKEGTAFFWVTSMLLSLCGPSSWKSLHFLGKKKSVLKWLKLALLANTCHSLVSVHVLTPSIRAVLDWHGLVEWFQVLIALDMLVLKHQKGKALPESSHLLELWADLRQSSLTENYSDSSHYLLNNLTVNQNYYRYID